MIVSLPNQLLAFLTELDVEWDSDLHENTSLIKSGLFDSLALFNLAQWIEKKIGEPLDLTRFDLREEWDTAAGIVKFIEKHRAN